MATRGILVMMAASVGVVLVGMMVWSGGRPAPRDQARGASAVSASANAPALGIHGSAVDSARRDKSELAASTQITPLENAQVTPSDAIKRRGDAIAAAPPIAVSAVAVAESAEILAARPQVLAAVEGALAARRREISGACWAGEVPASASFPVEASYGADGLLLALSISDDRRAPGIGACIRTQATLIPPSIAAPGVPVTVQTSLMLP